jgi:hypothetical protein
MLIVETVAKVRRAYFLQKKAIKADDSAGSRPAFRNDLARHSDLMSLTVPR